jgi:adenine-specific DNA methylase
MVVVDSLWKPRASAREAERSAQASRDAARLCVVAGAVISAARDVRARSRQLVSTTQYQRRLRSPEDHVAVLDLRQDHAVRHPTRATDERLSTASSAVMP